MDRSVWRDYLEFSRLDFKINYSFNKPERNRELNILRKTVENWSFIQTIIDYFIVNFTKTNLNTNFKNEISYDTTRDI